MTGNKTYKKKGEKEEANNRQKKSWKKYINKIKQTKHTAVRICDDGRFLKSISNNERNISCNIGDTFGMSSFSDAFN